MRTQTSLGIMGRYQIIKAFNPRPSEVCEGLATITFPHWPGDITTITFTGRRVPVITTGPFVSLGRRDIPRHETCHDPPELLFNNRSGAQPILSIHALIPLGVASPTDMRS